MKLTLKQALDEGRLAEFVDQEEAEGRTADREEFERRLGALIKVPLQEDQTSRSPARGGSRGKRTH